MDELKKQYEDLLRAYKDNQNPPTGTTREDLEDLKRKAELAEETFRASFGDKLAQTPGLLSFPIELAVATMLQWASTLLPPAQGIHSVGKEEFYNDIAACSSRLRELTSETEVNDRNTSRQTSPWPFVRKLKYVRALQRTPHITSLRGKADQNIRVYLKAYILSNGLIIADLPGEHESSWRVRICVLVAVGLLILNNIRFSGFAAQFTSH